MIEKTTDLEPKKSVSKSRFNLQNPINFFITFMIISFIIAFLIGGFILGKQ